MSVPLSSLMAACGSTTACASAAPTDLKKLSSASSLALSACSVPSAMRALTLPVYSASVLTAEKGAKPRASLACLATLMAMVCLSWSISSSSSSLSTPPAAASTRLLDCSSASRDLAAATRAMVPLASAVALAKRPG